MPRGTCGALPMRKCSTRCARGARCWRLRSPPERWGSIVQRMASRDPIGCGSASVKARWAGDGGVTRVSSRSCTIRSPPGWMSMGAHRRDNGRCQGRRPASRGPPGRARATTGPRSCALIILARSAGASVVAIRRNATIPARLLPTSTGARGAKEAPGGRASSAVGSAVVA